MAGGLLGVYLASLVGSSMKGKSIMYDDAFIPLLLGWIGAVLAAYLLMCCGCCLLASIPVDGQDDPTESSSTDEDCFEDDIEQCNCGSTGKEGEEMRALGRE